MNVITQEERAQWRESINEAQDKEIATSIAWDFRVNSGQIENLLDALEYAEAERDYIMNELLDTLAQWDGEWMPHPKDYDPLRKSVCTKEEAIASWLSHAFDIPEKEVCRNK